MATPTANRERERLLKLAEEYRDRGYEVWFHPNPEDLPDFLKNYRLDMVVRRGKEAVVIEVTSRASLDSSPQHLRDLAKAVEQHPGWRFQLVMTNPEDAAYFSKAESPLQAPEIESRMEIARQIATQYPESAILYSWSLVEATLRLVAEQEGIGLQGLDLLALIKQLATEGVISRSQYQLLMDARSLRNAVAHGFKTTQLTPESVYELVDTTEQLLKALQAGEAAN